MMVDIATDTLAGAIGFRELPMEALSRLTDRGSRRRFHPGEQLFQQGDRADALFVIIRGRVRLSSNHPSILETDSLAELGPRELVGETGVLDGVPRWATATVLDDTEVLQLGVDALARTLLEYPAFGAKLLCSLSRKLRTTTDLEEWYGAHRDPS